MSVIRDAICRKREKFRVCLRLIAKQNYVPREKENNGSGEDSRNLISLHCSWDEKNARRINKIHFIVNSFENRSIYFDTGHFSITNY